MHGTLHNDVSHLRLRARLIVLNTAQTTPPSRARRAYGWGVLAFNLIGWPALALILWGT